MTRLTVDREQLDNLCQGSEMPGPFSILPSSFLGSWIELCYSHEWLHTACWISNNTQHDY